MSWRDRPFYRHFLYVFEGMKVAFIDMERRKRREKLLAVTEKTCMGIGGERERVIERSMLWKLEIFFCLNFFISFE